jgi:predicted phosphodiesterase
MAKAGRPPGASHDLLREFLDSHPDLPSRTAARIAYRDYPTMWTTQDACLTMVRKLRGASGTESRKNQKCSSTKALPGIGMPTPFKEFEHPEFFNVNDKGRVLILADVHIPYHDPKALEAAVKYGKSNKVSTVLLLGDALDFHGISKFEESPEKRNLSKELTKYREFFTWLRQEFPKARIIFKEGNHEERYNLFMIKKAYELLGVEQFSLTKVLDLEKRGIEHVNERRKIMLGKLMAVHGHELKLTSGQLPARNLYNKMTCNVIAGHVHKTSTSTTTTALGHRITTQTIGTLGKLRRDYAVINQWDQSFGEVDVSNGGAWELRVKKVIDGKAW